MECRIENLSIYYEVHGQGRPILMLHGWTVDHTLMVRDLEPIFQGRDGWQRIYLDLPGRGNTVAADWITNQDQILNLVLDFIDAVIPGKRFVLAGLSYGGYLARAILHHRADQLDGLLLIVPVIRADSTQQDTPPLVVFREDPALLAALPADLAESFRNSVVVQERRVLERFRSEVLAAVERTERAFLSRLHQHYTFSFDVDALPKPFPGPVLVLLGRQDTDVGFNDALRLIDNYPRGTFALLDRAGHLLPLEQETLYRALIGEWLLRVEEYVGRKSAEAG